MKKILGNILLLSSCLIFLSSCGTLTKKEYCLDKDIVDKDQCSKEWLEYQERKKERQQRYDYYDRPGIDRRM